MAKFLDLEGVKTLWAKIKAQFVSKSELEQRLLEVTEQVEAFSNTFSQEFERIYGQIDNFQDAQEVEDIIAEVLPDLIPRTVPYTLRFVETPFETKDFNTFTYGNGIYNVYGTYANSPREDTIQGTLFNFVIQKENVYNDIVDVKYLHQFLILQDGEIYNRFRSGSEWTEWKQIQREYPR